MINYNNYIIAHTLYLNQCGIFGLDSCNTTQIYSCFLLYKIMGGGLEILVDQMTN